MSNNIHDILHRLSEIEGGVRARLGKVYESEVPALLRPREIQLPVTESDDISEARLEEKASEDILSKVKASFTDYLRGLEDDIKNDREILDKKKQDLDLTKKSIRDLELQAPERVEEDDEVDMPPPVKRFTLECGTDCDIYGNDSDGYVVRRGTRELPTRFNSLDDADMALQLFNARRSAPVQDSSADYLEEK